MNVGGGDDLYVSGFNRDLRFDRDDAYSLTKSTNSSNHSLLVSTNKSDGSGSPHSKGVTSSSWRQGIQSKSNNKSSSSNNNKYTRGPRGAIETDFYRNPTVLSRMILFGKYASANKRCRDHPEEGSVWVCAKRKSNIARQVSPFYGLFEKKHNRSTKPPVRGQEQQSNNSNDSSDDYSLRQLPIHISCTALAFTHDTVLRSELEQLIVRLVVTYPEGCVEFDHGGRMPLHEAIWSNASPETVSMILMASPKSIDQGGKFGRTPQELNRRRSGKHKKEVQDMLDLGVDYWDLTRQEAKLRLKLAVIPSANKSVASTSVMGTSQVEKESICTTDTANYNSAPLPVDKQRRQPRIEFKPEEIAPTAWEQLEQRVIILERLLAEMYETNYDLAGVVEELKKAKTELTSELEVARAVQEQSQSNPATTSSIMSPVAKARSPRISLEPTVAVVPEDDEMGSVKLMEHTERVEQLESLVGSYHSKIRNKRRATAEGSKVSELSSFSSHTEDGAFVRNRTGLARSDSLVSGLTIDEASFFDASIHAVKGAWRNSLDDDDDKTNDTIAELGESRREVTEVLGTDNLDQMFHKVAGRYGSGQKKAPAQEPSPRTSIKAWAPPIAIPSPAPTDTPPDIPEPTPRRSNRAWASPAAFPSPIDVPPKLPEPSPQSSTRSWAAPVAIPSLSPAESLPDLPLLWEPPPMDVDEETRGSASSSPSSSPSTASSMEESPIDVSPKLPELSPQSSTRSWAAPVAIPSLTPAESLPDLPLLWEPPPMDVEEETRDSASSSPSSSPSTASSMEESRASAPGAAEIHYPGFLVATEPADINSTISLSASSATSMSENSTIVSDFSFLGRSAPHSAQGPGDEPTAETMSTRGRLEHMVFGGASHKSDRQEDSDDSTLDPARYNYDIRIPALDTYFTETGEI